MQRMAGLFAFLALVATTVHFTADQVSGRSRMPIGASVGSALVSWVPLANAGARFQLLQSLGWLPGWRNLSAKRSHELPRQHLSESGQQLPARWNLSSKRYIHPTAATEWKLNQPDEQPVFIPAATG